MHTYSCIYTPYDRSRFPDQIQLQAGSEGSDRDNTTMMQMTNTAPTHSPAAAQPQHRHRRQLQLRPLCLSIHCQQSIGSGSVDQYIINDDDDHRRPRSDRRRRQAAMPHMHAMVISSASCRLLMAFLLLMVFAGTAEATGPASTVVAGMVFCDQCKDGARGLFDYPLYGARVAIQCGGGDTPLTVRESNTNWFGGFSIRMEGSPDMNRCTARVVQATGHCGAAASAGAPRELTLAFRMLGLALYTVPPLLSQPEEAMDFCPGHDRFRRSRPPPAAAQAQAPAPASPLPPFWRRRPRLLPPVPVWRKPPTLPQEQQPKQPEPQPQQVLPPPSPPPPSAPAQGSACTYDMWASPDHRCHWKVLTPNTTVAMAFGPLTAQRYGSELTLGEALEGRGDMYRTLLREATAALLNAYYNAPGGPFLYPTTASVMDHMNGALLSSGQRVLLEGARFRRANAGGGGPAGRTRLPCDFTPCCASASVAAPPPAASR